MAINVLALQALVETNPASGGTPGRLTNCFKHVHCTDWG
jgi:hypothetical protein